MLESLRARLLLWYALILALVVVAFASAVCYVYWRSLVRAIDRDLQAQAAAISTALRRDASGFFDLALPPQYRTSEFVGRYPRAYYAVWDSSGALIDRSDASVAAPDVVVAGISERNGHRETTLKTPQGASILVGRDLSEARRDVRALAFTISGVGGAVLLCSLLGGWFLAGRALAPIARISRAAKAMAQGDLSARIAVDKTENELGQVALALNEAFERQHLAAEVQRRFTADASHELRTPLATLQATLDWALKRPRQEAEYVSAMETCRRAGQRMADTVEELITIAQQDASVESERRPVMLAPLVEEAIALLQPLAAQRSVAIVSNLEPALVVGDESRLLKVVTNLLKNAVEYNHPDGAVDVALSTDGEMVTLRVRDRGIGIAAEDLPHVFDRFFRADKSRTRRGGGTGLGLAIAKRVVDDHGGTIVCRSELGAGTEIVVRLPAAAEEPSRLPHDVTTGDITTAGNTPARPLPA